MIKKNRYTTRSKITEANFRQIVHFFAVDLDVSQMARLSKIHRNSINRYLSAIRERAADFCNALSPISGDTEVDELFFGARRVRGKRGAAPRVKPLCLASLNVTTKPIPT